MNALLEQPPVIDPVFEQEMAAVAARVVVEEAAAHVAEAAPVVEAPVAPATARTLGSAAVYRSTGTGVAELEAREEIRDLGVVGANGRVVGRTSVNDALALLELERIAGLKSDKDDKKKK